MSFSGDPNRQSRSGEVWRNKLTLLKLYLFTSIPRSSQGNKNCYWFTHAHERGRRIYYLPSALAKDQVYCQTISNLTIRTIFWDFQQLDGVYLIFNLEPSAYPLCRTSTPLPLFSTLNLRLCTSYGISIINITYPKGRIAELNFVDERYATWGHSTILKQTLLFETFFKLNCVQPCSCVHTYRL